MKKTSRLLSLLLAALMLTCCIPLSTWAAEETADPSQSNAPYAWPLPSSGAITQGYSSDEHQALDIAIEEGTPVLAAESGTVVHTQVWDGVTMDGDQSYGNMVMLSHADGNTTLYAHLSEISVSPGDAVEKGSEIGKSGTTGNSTGPHLHLEVRTADGRVDPMKFLQGSQEPLSPEESETVSDESAPETQDAPLEEKAAEAEYTPLSEDGVSLQAAHQTKGTLISTGDIHVFTDAPATDTFGEIGSLMNKMMEYPDGSRDTAYCIELGVEVNYPEDYENVEDLIPDPQHLRLVGDALTFGFKAEDGRIDSAEENARYAATQILIWEILEGGFGSPQAEKDVLTCLAYTADPAEAKSFYRSLVEAVESKYVLPSFAAENAESAVPIELKWDGTKYTAAVTDSNGALSRYRWSGDGLTFDQSGNTLTISADAPLSETIRLRADCETEGGPGAVICWQNKDPSRQNIATGWNASDTVSAYIAVSCESAGYLKIVKTSEDGQVAGIPFHISGNGIDRDVVTGPDGIIEVDGLQAGTYTVTEQTPDKYVQPASQQVEVFPGRVSSVRFSNILKKFTVEVKKVDAATGEAQGDASLDGAVYGLYKGETLLDTYTTENRGGFTTKAYPCGTDFSLREITPSEGYLLDKTVYPVGAEPGNFSLENNSIPITVTEDVVLGSIAITKHTDRPADDGNSDQIEQPEEGAEFQVYLASAGSYENAGESERDILRTDSNGFARSKDLPHGLYVVHQAKGEDGQKFVPDFTVFISEHGKTYYRPHSRPDALPHHQTAPHHLYRYTQSKTNLPSTSRRQAQHMVIRQILRLPAPLDPYFQTLRFPLRHTPHQSAFCTHFPRRQDIPLRPETPCNDRPRMYRPAAAAALYFPEAPSPLLQQIQTAGRLPTRFRVSDCSRQSSPEKPQPGIRPFFVSYSHFSYVTTLEFDCLPMQVWLSFHFLLSGCSKVHFYLSQSISMISPFTSSVVLSTQRISNCCVLSVS